MLQSDLEIRYLSLVLLHIVGPRVFDFLLFFLVLALGQFNLVHFRLNREHSVLLRLELARYSLIIPPERRHLLLDCLEFQLLHIDRLALQLDHFSVRACQFLKVDQSAPHPGIRLLDLLADLLRTEQFKQFALRLGSCRILIFKAVKFVLFIEGSFGIT